VSDDGAEKKEDAAVPCFRRVVLGVVSLRVLQAVLQEHDPIFADQIACM
jgi:hypothetical protein